MANNVFCIDCKRSVDDHAPDCECAAATDLIGMMGVPCVVFDLNGDLRMFGAHLPPLILPGRHDVGYPKHEGD